MPSTAYTLFDTPVGRCGIAWGPRGVRAIQLPEAREHQTRDQLLVHCVGAAEGHPPADVRQTIDGIVALLRGEPSVLGSIPLDTTGVSPFDRRVYDLARTVPPGSTISYGEIATRLGAPGAARAVGQALGRNPFPLVVPCHRVLAASGRLGGFSGGGGVAMKLRLLSIERAHVAGAVSLFGGDGTLGFDPVAAVAHLRMADPILARVIDKVGALHLQPTRAGHLFAALAEAIVYQQLTGKAAATIFARLCALFPRVHEGPTAAQVLRASDGKLRSAGLSRAKALSLRDLARRTVSGEIPPLAELGDLDDEEIIGCLTQVRGVGRWTVEMLLIFRLGRPDVLPADDYGIRKGFSAVFGTRDLPTRGELEARGERWKPFRTAASWYLWRALDLGPGGMNRRPEVVSYSLPGP